MKRDEFAEISESILQVKLIINRIPTGTKEEFTSFAKDEFCDDYGMAFKYIWEYCKNDVVLKDILERVRYLEQQKVNPQAEEPKKKMLDGRRLDNARRDE